MSLQLREVTRRFGDVVALNRVTLEADGDVVALVGPNGSGKSTLMKVLTSHVKPTSGTVTAFGQPVWNNPGVLARIGYVPEQDALYDNMTGVAFVTTMAELSGMAPQQAKRSAQEELEKLGLDPGLEIPMKSYSKGMRQRAKLAQALVHRPSLLLLDEPLLGCDPVARRRIQDRVQAMRNEGCTVLVSTHILKEVERITRDIAFLAGGRLMARGNAGEIRAKLSQVPSRVKVYCEAPRVAAGQLAAWEGVDAVSLGEGHVEVHTRNLRGFLERLQDKPAASWRMTGHETLDADLESLFGYLAGGNA